MSDEHRVVAQIRLTAEEIDSLNYLQYHYRVTSRSQVLRNLIRLGKMLAKHTEAGNTLFLQSTNGEQTNLAFLGMGGVDHGKAK